VIYKLEEPYPTECYNHGQLAKQTQTWYMCRSIKNPRVSDAFRVTKETYNRILANYADQFSCYVQNTERNVCVCPQNMVDFECGTSKPTKCYINITEPAFW